MVVSNAPTSDQPCQVSAEEGQVLLNGIEGVDATLTPEAAEQTGDRLIEESVRARGQRRMKDNPHRAG